MVSYGLTMPTMVAFIAVHTHKAQGIYMVTARESSPLQCRQPSNFAWQPCRCTINCSLPLLCSAQVCGRHMALLPSFLASELATMWHVANPAYICLTFCYPKHKKDVFLRPQQHIVTYRSPKHDFEMCVPSWFLLDLPYSSQHACNNVPLI